MQRVATPVLRLVQQADARDALVSHEHHRPSQVDVHERVVERPVATDVVPALEAVLVLHHREQKVLRLVVHVRLEPENLVTLGVLILYY